MFTENKTTELKREYVDDIKNTAIAFANCDGGTLSPTATAAPSMWALRTMARCAAWTTQTAPCSGSPTPSGTPCARI